MFVADGGECLVAQSYAKNMGLYGERVGALSIVSHCFDVSYICFDLFLNKLTLDMLVINTSSTPVKKKLILFPHL